MSRLGTVVVGKYTFDIDRIYLGEGKVWFAAIGHGPMNAMRNATAKVYGPDGELIYEHQGLISFGKIARDGRLYTDFPMAVINKTSRRALTDADVVAS